MPFSRGSPSPGIEPIHPAVADGFFTTEPPEKPISTLLPLKISSSGMDPDLLSILE